MNSKKNEKFLKTTKPATKPAQKADKKPGARPGLKADAKPATDAPVKPKVNTTVYVSNLNYKRDEVGIKKLFSRYGKIKKIKIVIDLETEKSKGMAFVEMSTVTEAKAAIAGLNGEVIDGRTLKASWAIPQEKPWFNKFKDDDDRKPKKSFKKFEDGDDKKPAKKKFMGSFKRPEGKAPRKSKG